MDLKKILHSLENCPCGKQHTFVTERVEIESGLTPKTGKILCEENFPKKVLVVSDDNAIKAADGVLETQGDCFNDVLADLCYGDDDVEHTADEDH